MNAGPSIRRWFVLAVALIVGAVAAWSAHRYLRARVEQIEQRERNRETVTLVVAREPLPKGTRLSATNVAVRPVPREWAHGNAIQPAQFPRAEGAALETAAQAGEPILWAQLEGQRVPTFSARLAPGRRAITVPVDDVSSTSGMVAPGDLVDIVVTVSRRSERRIFALMQGVRVLATGRVASLDGHEPAPGASRGFTTITLDATPDDAKRVIAAREVGKITAMLRSPGDRSAIAVAPADPYVLLGMPGDARAAAGAGTPVIYGGGAIRLPDALVSADAGERAGDTDGAR